MRMQWIMRCQHEGCDEQYIFGNEYTQYENAKAEARAAGWQVGIYCDQTEDLCPVCKSKP